VVSLRARATAGIANSPRRNVVDTSQGYRGNGTGVTRAAVAAGDVRRLTQQRSSGTGATVKVMATHWTLGCDAVDLHRLAAFWALALGYVDEPGYDDPHGASIIDADGKGPAVGFLLVPEGKSAKNRLHIDLRVAGEAPWDSAERERLMRAKVPELVAAGAVVLREVSYRGKLAHVVMLDPEGNEFCVA